MDDPASSTEGGRARGDGPPFERLLLVEYDARVAWLMAHLLRRRLLLEVVVVLDGATALALLREDRAFDGIVADVDLPPSAAEVILGALAISAPGVPVGLWTASRALREVDGAPFAFRQPKDADVATLIADVRRMLRDPAARASE